MIEIKTPGKLYIAGEYSVVNPGHKAILMSVDKFITIKIKKAEHRGYIKSYSNIKMIWSRQGSDIIVEQEDDRFEYIFSAMNIVEKYIVEKGMELKVYDIEVVSDLETKDGIKYGLGSSAAIVVGIVKAILQFYEVEYTKLELFKLSVLANIQINRNGSCGDIASSVYNGLIVYTSFSRENIFKRFASESIKSILNSDWEHLDIKELSINADFNFLIGWTKSPASSNNLVKKSKKNIDKDEKFFKEFLSESDKCVEDIVKAYENNDYRLMLKSVEKNRKLLLEYSNNYNIVIENKKLKNLIDLAKKHRFASKSSGAGGGDCGFAIYKSFIDTSLLIKQWKDKGIDLLKLDIYKEI